jgi:hypothetical protein
MRRRHAQALKDADDSPVNVYSDRKMQVSNLAGAKEPKGEDEEDASFCQLQELPSLRCSIIDGPGSSKAPLNHEKVDWNDLLVRESIPDDYGTIRATDTNRVQNEKLKQQEGNMIMQNFN